MEKGQLFDTWGHYNRYLQHVLSLRDIFVEERRLSQSFKAPKIFCEMLSDYQRYAIPFPAIEEGQEHNNKTSDTATIQLVVMDVDQMPLFSQVSLREMRL